MFISGQYVTCLSLQKLRGWDYVVNFWQRSVLLIFAVVLFFLSVSLIEAGENSAKILAVTSGKSPVYDQVIDHLNDALRRRCTHSDSDCLSIDQVVQLPKKTDEMDRIIMAAQPDLLVTLGSKAAKNVAALKIKIPTLYALLPESVFDGLPLCCQRSVSALFINHSLKQQVRLIRAALPEYKRLGVLYGPLSRVMSKPLQLLASEAGLQLESELVMQRKGVGTALKKLLRRADLILALPDAVVYSKQTVFNILLSSYHNNVPVIGFSQGYVKAGALFAIHSTPQQFGRQLAEMVEQYLPSGLNNLPPPQYPAYFNVATNENVARSFKLTLPDEETLRKYATGELE